MNIITWLKTLENKAKTLSLLLKKSLKNGIIYIVERVLNMACNYQKFLYNDYKELLSKYTKQENLLKETKELISNLIKVKPSTAKGTYIKSISVSSTMSKGIKCNVNSLI